MTPLRRLTIGGLLAFAGSALAVFGTRLPAYTRIVTGREFDLGGTSARLPEERIAVSLGQLSGVVSVIAVLMLIAAVLAFLVGPRARATAFAAIVGGAAFLVILAATVSEPSRHGERRAGGPARAVTIAGALAAAGGAAAAVKPAWRVPRLRMPESAPEE